MSGHRHHDHEHIHGDHHGHRHAVPEDVPARLRCTGPLIVVALIALLTFSATCLTVVEPGQAVVLTAFGAPVRVMTEPGLTLRWPAPFEAVVPVDVRLRTTSTGLHDVGTRDGLRILVQAYVEWRVPPDAGRVVQYLQAVRNAPDEAAEQLRSYLGSSLEIVAARYDLSQLVNTDPSRVRLDAFEDVLKAHLQAQVLAGYGISILHVGIERLTLPGDTLEATVTRMTAERNTVAARINAEGERAASEIESDASRDARIVAANARAEAARVEARAGLQAADIYAAAYSSAPGLYTLLRSLDMLGTVVGDNTRLVLRTDAAPFGAFVSGPSVMAPAAASDTVPGAAPAPASGRKR